MDFRLALLLNHPLGLALDPIDLTCLIDISLDPYDVVAVTAALRSERARSYVKENRDWIRKAEAVLLQSERHSVRWSYLGQPDYPALWEGLSRRPVIFSYQGEAAWLDHSLLAVVGSRTPSPDTLEWMQQHLAEFLKRRRVGVVSGGARGVDQWAHLLSLGVRQPTVCILPSGILNPYPFGKEELWAEIRDGGGCIVSTCALREPMRKSFFHIRNGWIAGLSAVCFVAEANRRSGSLLTAKAAADEQRDLCTLPVFPTATQGLGNLDLLANGAVMLRDHLDLATLWDRARPFIPPSLSQRLSPASPEGIQRDAQKHEVHQP